MEGRPFAAAVSLVRAENSKKRPVSRCVRWLRKSFQLEILDVFRVIKKINEAGTSILLIEQNAFLALQTADRAYVLETGKISMQGDAKELLKDPRVKEAYLGA